MKKIKILLLVLLLIGLSSCKLFNARKGNDAPIEDGYAVSYYILYTESIDSINVLNKQIKSYKDSIKLYRNIADSLDYYLGKAMNECETLQDSVDFYKEDAFVYKYKIERIKAYDKIVRNNSSQSKYFLGWVRRVLED